MSTTLVALQLAAALALGQFTTQRLEGEPLPPAQEARAQAIAKELRCAVCQGLSVADSPSSMARAQLERVREMVAEGKSDQEVRDYFVARYGGWVLLEPEAEGVNLLVWVGPVVLVAVGLMLILRQLGTRRGPEDAPGEAGSPTATGSAPGENTEDEYLRAVRAETDR
ncbi:MAG: cytochrome c-type biogenesis protein CcmH [Myxococcaceae bacterium]|nr:cytochrome c-type biogenesis protein CcmH [Myxococcaceae bacterium]